MGLPIGRTMTANRRHVVVALPQQRGDRERVKCYETPRAGRLALPHCLTA